jgi:hypothetical protein
VSYPLEQAVEEVAFIAYYFHWTHAETMALPHVQRRRWVAEISRLNREATA